jgi:hypothetical protein
MLEKRMYSKGKGSVFNHVKSIKPCIFLTQGCFHEHFEDRMHVIFFTGGQYTWSTGARLQVRTVSSSRRDKERRFSRSLLQYMYHRWRRSHIDC